MTQSGDASEQATAEQLQAQLLAHRRDYTELLQSYQESQELLGAARASLDEMTRRYTGLVEWCGRALRASGEIRVWRTPERNLEAVIERLRKYEALDQAVRQFRNYGMGGLVGVDRALEKLDGDG